MPSFKYVIELSDQDKATLMEILKKGNSPARTILRANILLASDKRNDKYMTVSEIADAYHTTPTTVQTVGLLTVKRALKPQLTGRSVKRRRFRQRLPGRWRHTSLHLLADSRRRGIQSGHCGCLRTERLSLGI